MHTITSVKFLNKLNLVYLDRTTYRPRIFILNDNCKKLITKNKKKTTSVKTNSLSLHLISKKKTKPYKNFIYEPKHSSLCSEYKINPFSPRLKISSRDCHLLQTQFFFFFVQRRITLKKTTNFTNDSFNISKWIFRTREADMITQKPHRSIDFGRFFF